MKNLYSKFIVEVARELIEKYRITPYNAYEMVYEYFTELEEPTHKPDMMIVIRKRVMRKVYSDVVNNMTIPKNIEVYHKKRLSQQRF